MGQGRGLTGHAWVQLRDCVGPRSTSPCGLVKRSQMESFPGLPDGPPRADLAIPILIPEHARKESHLSSAAQNGKEQSPQKTGNKSFSASQVLSGEVGKRVNENQG